MTVDGAVFAHGDDGPTRKRRVRLYLWVLWVTLVSGVAGYLVIANYVSPADDVQFARGLSRSECTSQFAGADSVEWEPTPPALTEDSFPAGILEGFRRTTPDAFLPSTRCVATFAGDRSLRPALVWLALAAGITVVVLATNAPRRRLLAARRERLADKHRRLDREWVEAARRLGISTTRRRPMEPGSIAFFKELHLEGVIAGTRVTVFNMRSESRSWTHYRAMRSGISRVRWERGERNLGDLRFRKHQPVDENETVFVHPDDAQALRPEQAEAIAELARISWKVRVGTGKIDMYTDPSITADAVESNVLALVSSAQVLAS